MGSKKGWIKLHRQLQDCSLWKDKPFAKGQAWVDMLLLANHEDNKIVVGGENVTIERGQFHTSIDILATRWGWNDKRKVRRFLDDLSKEQMLYRKSDTNGTTVTIAKYDFFQIDGIGDGTSNGTTNGTSNGTSESLINSGFVGCECTSNGTSNGTSNSPQTRNKEIKNYIHTYRGEIQQANFEQVSGLNSEQKNTLNDWFDKINDKYPKPCRERKGRMLFFGLFTSYPESMWLSIREDMVQAIQDTLDEYDKQNPDDKSYKFLKNYGTWLEDECMERLLKVERNKQND